ncbi:MAG: hypothetical protein R2865_07755 [Deinococcales bacterium]
MTWLTILRAIYFSVFDIRGFCCGALICHDYRYPELYREYKRRV